MRIYTDDDDAAAAHQLYWRLAAGVDSQLSLHLLTFGCTNTALVQRA
jgi:hypothetical protein